MSLRTRASPPPARTSAARGTTSAAWTTTTTSARTPTPYSNSEAIKTADGINVTLESNLSYPATSNSASQDEFISLEKNVSSRSRLIQVLCLGLILYVLDVGLHLTIAGHYLGMRDCHRGVEHVFKDFTLSEIVNLNNSIQDVSATINSDAATSKLEPSPIKSFLDKQLYFKVRHKLITLAPEHWVQRVQEIVDFQLSKYKLSHISDLCAFNGRKFPNAFEAGAYVCRDALTPNQQMSVADAFNGISEKDEEAVLKAALAGENDQLVLTVVRSLTGRSLNPSSLAVARKFTSELSAEEMGHLRKFLEHPDVSKNMLATLEAMSKVDPKHFDILGEAFSRVRKPNVPKIEAAFKKLNITFSSFLTDPTLFVKFLKDQEATEVLLTVQSLLPTFGPRVLNSMLVVKNAFDSAPGADKVLDRIFRLPMSLMMKLVGMRVSWPIKSVLKSQTN